MATRAFSDKVQLKDPSLFRDKSLINNQWVASPSGATFQVDDPATLRIIGSLPELTATDTEEAVAAATRAFESWRLTSTRTRYGLLMKWRDLMYENLDDLAAILTLENGKAKGEIKYAASFLEWFAEEAKRIEGDILASPVVSQRLMVIKQPIGPVALLTPWNFPAAMITRKVGAALAAGCTAVIKPAAETPYSALALGELALRAGIPEGVVNIVTTNANLSEISLKLTTHPAIKKVSFTGSTRIGQLIMKQSASTLKKLSLELGGNASFIVFEDADIDQAVEGAISTKFRNNGQTCVCANRFYIHDSIYDTFAERFSAKVEALRVGNGFAPGVQLGPLIHQGAVAKVRHQIRDAVAKGARVVTGGQARPTPGDGGENSGDDGSPKIEGNFFEPTVLVDVSTDMFVHSEETFGPVAPLFRFHDEAQVVQWANDCDVGLASYFYTRDLSRAWRVAEQLETGMVGVNTGNISMDAAPFGGVKQSGFGREGSKYGIAEYLNIKYINMNV
ncbi:hypothetical protein H4R33_005506 [Dimargaris cristalligena]|nr:hypothetical protein H4R33_005506 [Dimargaris cristalligena]